jgi:hypothetical protein
MPIIAITREMGSLGKDVARGLGEELGVPVIYHEVAPRTCCARYRMPYACACARRSRRASSA